MAMQFSSVMGILEIAEKSERNGGRSLPEQIHLQDEGQRFRGNLKETKNLEELDHLEG